MATILIVEEIEKRYAHLPPYLRCEAYLRDVFERSAEHRERFYNFQSCFGHRLGFIIAKWTDASENPTHFLNHRGEEAGGLQMDSFSLPAESHYPKICLGVREILQELARAKYHYESSEDDHVGIMLWFHSEHGRLHLNDCLCSLGPEFLAHTARDIPVL